MIQERRKELRFPINLSAQLIDSTTPSLRAPVAARILDISRNGMKLEVWHDAPIGSCFSLSLEYQDDDSLCLGEVMWKRDTTKGMVYGLRIIHWTYLTPPLASRISQFESHAGLQSPYVARLMTFLPA